MSIVSKATLISYFEDGDDPNGSQFTDLVDTLVAIDSTGSSFGAGSVPLYVTGTEYGVCSNSYVGIRAPAGNTIAGFKKEGLTFDNVGNYFKFQHYPLPVWDMSTDPTAFVDISSKVPTKARVLAIMITIEDDTGNIYGSPDISWYMVTNGYVVVERASGSDFETSGDFVLTSASRGKLTVIYDETLT